MSADLISNDQTLTGSTCLVQLLDTDLRTTSAGEREIEDEMHARSIAVLDGLEIVAVVPVAPAVAGKSDLGTYRVFARHAGSPGS